MEQQQLSPGERLPLRGDDELLLTNSSANLRSSSRVASVIAASFFVSAVVLLATHQSASVSLEEMGGAEGIASKVLLEQAQEAALLAKERLEKASGLHHQADDIKKELEGIIKRENTAAQEIEEDQKDASEAEHKGGAALVSAKEAYARHEEHAKEAEEVKQRSDELSRKAIDIDDEGREYKQKADAARSEADEAKSTIKRLKAQIKHSIEQMEQLKRQLIVHGNWSPDESVDAQEGARYESGGAGLTSGSASLSGRQYFHRYDSLSAAKAFGVNDNYVPVKAAKRIHTSYQHTTW